MIKIISDSSTLYSSSQARARGFYSVPLQVILDRQSYSDYEDLSSQEMAQRCREGATPGTSQPSIQRKLELYNELLQDPDNEVLDLCMADGLSGTYQSACSLRTMCEDPDRVVVFNTRTLCGPHRAMTETALQMAENGASMEEILQCLQAMQEQEASALMVKDFGFLQRGGRISRAKALAGSFLHLVPVAVKNEEGSSLEIVGAGRTFQRSFEKVLQFLQSRGLDEKWKLYICHGDHESAAQKARDWFARKVPGISIELYPLCPMFIAHGGPGCVAVQAIRCPEC